MADRSDLAAAARRLRARRELARRRLDRWCIALPQTGRGPYRIAPWLAVLLDELQRWAEGCARGESPRLMVSIPPQYGKSEAVLRLIAYILGRYALPVAVCTYSADLALQHSRTIRAYTRAPEARAIFPSLAPATTGAKSDRQDAWVTEGGGRLYAVGVGGPLTGRTPRAIVIDDAHKDLASATSRAEQERVWGWYRSVVYTRAAANHAGILAMGTRWADGDLLGRLRAEADAGGEQWRIVDFPALAETDDPLGRDEGEPLDPEIQTAEQLAQTRRAMGSRLFAALYQQRPAPAEGALIRVAWMSHRYREHPDLRARRADAVVLAVDGAATDGGGDHTVIGGWAFHRAGVAKVSHRRGQWDYPTMRQVLRDEHDRLARASGLRPAILVEAASNGRPVADELEREGYTVIRVNPGSRSKLARALPTLGPWEAGQVLLPEDADWVAGYVERMARVSGQGDEVDDELDETTYAILHWLGVGEQADPGYTPDALTAAARCLSAW